MKLNQINPDALFYYYFIVCPILIIVMAGIYANKSPSDLMFDRFCLSKNIPLQKGLQLKGFTAFPT